MSARRIATLLVAATTLARLIGCASSADGIVVDAGVADATSPAPPDPVPPPDAAADAAEPARDASADAAPAPCSPDGFCLTALPGPSSVNDAGIPSGTRRAASLRDVWIDAEGRAYAISVQGDLFRWRDSQWEVLLETGQPLRHLWAERPDSLWIARESGAVLHVVETPAGTFETTVEVLPTEASITSLHGRGSELWATTGFGPLLHRDAATGTWQEQSYPVEAEGEFASSTLDLVWGQGNDVWARGTQSGDCGGCSEPTRTLLLRRAVTDGGVEDWVGVSLAPTDGLAFSSLATTSGDASQLFLCGTGSCSLLRSAVPSGSSWSVGPEQITGAITAPGGVARALWVDPDQNVWLVGDSGMARRFDGTTWSVARLAGGLTPVLRDLHAVAGRRAASGATEIWIVGDEIALHRGATP